MLPLLGIFFVLTIASGAASHWQTPSGWQNVNPPVKKSPLPKVPPKGAVKHVAPKRKR